MAQVISKEEFKKIRREIAGKKVVLCHGVFDLIHPGHIIHFQEAKRLGDILVVSITSAQYVRKGPGRPYFNDEMRLLFLAAIEYIDYVMVSESPTVDDIIETVEPHLYVKGQEYARYEDDITGKIEHEVNLVRKHGGDVYYTSGQVFSSTKLINNAFPVFSDEVKAYIKTFKSKYTMQMMRDLSDKIQAMKILVIGDVIIDRCSYCDIQGLMSKDIGYSVRLKNAEDHLGGALAVARNIASFTDKLAIASVMGNEPEMVTRIGSEMEGQMQLTLEFSPSFPTIVKQRYIANSEEKGQLHKLLAVNNIPEPARIDDQTMQRFKQNLMDCIPHYDGVILCDYGHGLIDDEVMEIIKSRAKQVAVNCQTNSANYGRNIITKYSRADIFSVNQKELMLATCKDNEEGLVKLANQLNGRGWLTRGAKGVIGIEGDAIHTCPAFINEAKDYVGAGDAFLSVASLLAFAGAPMDVATFMGSVAAALSSNIPGNKVAITKVDILKFANTLLNI